MTDTPCTAASEMLLDAAVENTFPASDPIAVEAAFAAARRREECLPLPNKES
jgi:hypothetical protein